jgi:hypothetical protein
MDRSENKVERPSEFHFDTDHTWARIEYLKAIERVAPRVLDELKDRLLPVFTEIAPKSPAEMRLFDIDYHRQETLVEQLEPSLSEWAVHFRLDPSVRPVGDCGLLLWLRTTLYWTLVKWKTKQYDQAWEFPDKYAAVAYMESPEPFEFKDQGWAFLRVTEKAFRKQVKASFNNLLNTYIQEQSSGENRGWNHRLPKHIDPEHFDWLALYQIEELSSAKIAKRAGASKEVTRQAVEKAVKRAAEHLIGPNWLMWLRPQLRRGPQPRPPRSQI